jgi:hypothetical protein
MGACGRRRQEIAFIIGKGSYRTARDVKAVAAPQSYNVLIFRHEPLSAPYFPTSRKITGPHEQNWD